jgi:hypothetical protein
MPTIANRGAARLAVMVALVALVASGCGGGTKTSDPQTTTTQANAPQTNGPQANAPQTNGLEQQSPAQVQQAAAAALRAAKSVHVTGTAINNGRPVRVDLRLQGNASSGTMELEGVRLEITTIGNTTYLKANQQTWQTLGVPAAAAQRLTDQWVKTRPQQVTGLTGFSLDNLAAQLMKGDSPWEPKVEQTTLDGNKVVVISQKDGSKLYVANTGPPYPLRGEKRGANAGRTDFTEYGADFHITAPANATDTGGVG